MRFLLPTFRPVLADLAGTLIFYVLYLLTGSAAIGVGVGLAIGFAQIGWHLRRHGRVPTLLGMGVLLTIALGGLSALVHDLRLILLKPSIAYAAVGATMLPRGWVRRYIPPIGLDLLPARTFDRVGWGWAALMFATALVNLALVVLLPPRAAAAGLLLFGVASKLLLFGSQYALLRWRAGRVYYERLRLGAER